jgi:hypothetical protein
VLRRLALSLVFWVGVLGVTSPALACAAPAELERDCCPEGPSDPCGGGSTEARAPCCIAAPATGGAVAADVTHRQLARPIDNDSPDPLVLTAWLQTLVIGAAVPDPFVPKKPFSYLSDATLTYLRTGRLRL